MRPGGRRGRPRREDAALERDIRDELEFHVEMRMRDNLRRGMTPEAARVEAERRLSGREEIQEQMRAIGRSEARRRRRGERLNDAIRDVRYATRSLVRRPMFTFVAMLTLALGIGATTAIFSLTNRLLLRGVPGLADASRLVTVTFGSERSAGARFVISHVDYHDLAAATPALQSVAASFEREAHVARPDGGQAQRLVAELITANYASTLGLTGVSGRAPVAATGEDARVVMISDRLSSELFAHSATALGEVLTINGRPFTVIGIAPPAYRGPTTLGEVDLWLPLEAHRDLLPGYPADLLARRDRTLWMNLYGRLSATSSAEQASSQLRAAATRIVASDPRSSLKGLLPIVTEGVGLTAFARAQLVGTIRILAVVVAFLLLLTCANCANLLLVRASARTHELSVRRALGASRGRLVRQLLTEAMLLGLAGGASGLALAVGGLQLFRGERLMPWLPPLSGIGPDGRVLGFAVLLSLVTGMLFGVAPALISARRGEGTLRGARIATGRDRLRTGLVVAQVAISLALLVGAGLLLDTVRALRSVPLGFDSDHVVELSVDPGTQGYDVEAQARFFRTLLEGTRAVPGVTAAGLAYAPIQGRIAAGIGLKPEGASRDDPRAVSTDANFVSAGFLSAAGLSLLEGRDFRDDEVMPSTPPARGVVLVSESAARQLFPEGGALGKVVDAGYDEPRLLEIVGVFADARLRDPRTPGGPVSLEPAGQTWPISWATLYVRGTEDAARVELRMREIVRELDAALPLYDVQPLRRRLDSRLAAERLLARATTLFACLALTLAAVGLYGVLGYSVEQRTREFGVRLALGAAPRRVRVMVLREGLATAALGIAIGLIAAAQAGRLVASRLFGVSPFEPMIFAAAATALLAAAILASWIPAWRATRSDPLGALRSE